MSVLEYQHIQFCFMRRIMIMFGENFVVWVLLTDLFYRFRSSSCPVIAIMTLKKRTFIVSEAYNQYNQHFTKEITIVLSGYGKTAASQLVLWYQTQNHVKHVKDVTSMSSRMSVFSHGQVAWPVTLSRPDTCTGMVVYLGQGPSCSKACSSSRVGWGKRRCMSLSNLTWG